MGSMRGMKGEGWGRCRLTWACSCRNANVAVIRAAIRVALRFADDAVCMRIM